MGFSRLEDAKKGYDQRLKANRTIPADQLQGLHEELYDKGRDLLGKIIELDGYVGVLNSDHNLSLMTIGNLVNWRVFPDFLREPFEADAARGRCAYMAVKTGIQNPSYPQLSRYGKIELKMWLELTKELPKKWYERRKRIVKPSVSFELLAEVIDKPKIPFTFNAIVMADDSEDSWGNIENLDCKYVHGMPDDERHFLRVKQGAKIFEGLMEVAMNTCVWHQESKTRALQKKG